MNASQNIQGALRYLPNINVPYCNAKEAEILEKAISYVFTDMQTRERHEHALNCYQTTYKRVAALAQWLGQVISSTIARDLQEVTENCRGKAAELRNERVRLIRLRLRELTGQDVDISTGTPVDMMRGRRAATCGRSAAIPLIARHAQANFGPQTAAWTASWTTRSWTSSWCDCLIAVIERVPLL